MSISDLFGSGEHQRNLAHLASIVNIASVNGKINEKEEAFLSRLARKLNVNKAEYETVLKDYATFAIHPPHTEEQRLEVLYDILRIIFLDHQIEEQEEHLLRRYAIGIGFDPETSKELISRSIKILGGQISFDDFRYLLEKK